MSSTFRNSLSLGLILLILLSTIGVNLVTTLCTTCHDHHAYLTLSSPDEPVCSCCIHHEGSSQSCSKACACSTHDHQSKGEYAHLKIALSQNGEQEKLISGPAVLSLFHNDSFHEPVLTYENRIIVLPSGFNNPGRMILAMNCILRR